MGQIRGKGLGEPGHSKSYGDIAHGAPAHPFGDLRGLLATIGERVYDKLFRKMRKAKQAARGESPERMLMEMGIAYFQVMYHPHLADKSAYPALEKISSIP